MATLIGLLLKYLYDDIWTFYFYSKVLGRKYSLKLTIIIAGFWYLLPSVLKIGTMYSIGIDNMMIQITTWIGSVLYTVLVYRSTLGKRILALVLMLCVQIGVELMCYMPAEMLTGSFGFMLTDSMFTIVCILLQIPVEAAAYLVLIMLWKYMETIDWKTGKQLWLAVIFPLSQLCFVIHLGFYYTTSYVRVPDLSIVGLLISFLGDVCMFVLFFRSNRREKAEKGLRELKQQYEMEKIRYEHLMEMQEETAKMRHDFQNHLMVIKNMRLE